MVKAKKQVEADLEPEQLPGLKLDLACGQRRSEGFLGVDMKAGENVDVLVNLFAFPWPFEDDSVSEVVCSHFAEHIPHYRPEWGSVDGWWMFFNELYRVCRDGAKLVFIHPYVMNERAFWDPTHTRFLCYASWCYLEREWREREKLDHYDAHCDFKCVVGTASGMDADFMLRNQEVQAFQQRHYVNVIADLQVELRCVKPAKE